MISFILIYPYTLKQNLKAYIFQTQPSTPTYYPLQNLYIHICIGAMVESTHYPLILYPCLKGNFVPLQTEPNP